MLGQYGTTLTIPPHASLRCATLGGFFYFPCYFRYMDDKEIEIAIDQWIREVDSANLEPEEIAASFQTLCEEFNIPEDLGKKFVASALED
jgi:hypothetical protein